jgi:hypothetical protein
MLWFVDGTLIYTYTGYTYAVALVTSDWNADPELAAMCQMYNQFISMIQGALATSAITLVESSVIALAQSDTWSTPQSFCQSNGAHARARNRVGHSSTLSSVIDRRRAPAGTNRPFRSRFGRLTTRGLDSSVKSSSLLPFRGVIVLRGRATSKGITLDVLREQVAPLLLTGHHLLGYIISTAVWDDTTHASMAPFDATNAHALPTGCSTAHCAAAGQFHTLCGHCFCVECAQGLKAAMGGNKTFACPVGHRWSLLQKPSGPPP